jgi:hypothetical protein
MDGQANLKTMQSGGGTPPPAVQKHHHYSVEMALRAQRGCPHDPSFVKHRWSVLIKKRMAFGPK